MKINKIIDLIEGKIVEGEHYSEENITRIFASDLMSDVLTIKTEEPLLLITGLSNLQTIRTCEMSDIKAIIFVRGKKSTEDMRKLAAENDMILIETPFSMYRTSGILYNAGILPLY